MQRTQKFPRNASDELEGLQILTKHICASAPRLVNPLQSEQDESMWVPGGYLLYILMTRCPGKPIVTFLQKPPVKQNEIYEIKGMV